MSTPKFFTHDWGVHDWAQYRTGAKIWNWFDAIPNPSSGEAMPTTSGRFFALAARVESALPDAGLTKEQAAELVGALRSYWEQPSEQALVALKATHKGVWNTAIRDDKLNREHSSLSANNALCRAAEEFFANESDPDMVVSYLDKCDRLLGTAP